MECTRTVHLTGAILSVCLIGLLPSITAWAGTFEAPAFVMANPDGTYSYEATYTAGANEALDYESAEPIHNTIGLQSYGDGFCQIYLQEAVTHLILGEPIYGQLVDPTSLGIHRTSIGTCSGSPTPTPTPTPTATGGHGTPTPTPSQTPSQPPTPTATATGHGGPTPTPSQPPTPTATATGHSEPSQPPTPLPLGAAISEPEDLVEGWWDPIIIEGYGGTIDTTIVPFGSVACMGNIDCAPEQFCEKRPEACDSIGLCAQPPEFCTLEFLPVCGCDGNTYNNACEAARAGVSVESHGGPCGPTPTPTVTPTPVPTFDCLCQVTNINPNSITLNKVATGGKGSDTIRKMSIHLTSVDAPGATCDPGETSGPVPINLRMVDDDGDVLIDSAKTAVCNGGAKKVTRNVLVQGPVNCESSAVPFGFTTSVITATGSAPGTADYVEDLTINCHE